MTRSEMAWDDDTPAILGPVRMDLEVETRKVYQKRRPQHRKPKLVAGPSDAGKATMTDQERYRLRAYLKRRGVRRRDDDLTWDSWMDFPYPYHRKETR